MFHIMLILPILFVLIAIVSVILFSIVAIIAACIGGTTVAVFIKNVLVKKLLLLGFCMMFLIGLLCLTPFITVYANLSVMFFIIVSNLIYLCVIVLAIAGIKISRSISSKAGKAILIIVFCIVLIAVISLAIITGIAAASLIVGAV